MPSDSPASAALRFSDITGLDPAMVTVLERRSLTHAFPVQEAVIPHALAGKNLHVQSPTGSGKTLAFGLPIIEGLERATNHTAAVILVPTRELAQQVAEDLAPLATGKQLRVVPVFGGTPVYRQAKLARGAAILVATPGRLQDLIDSRSVDMRACTILVLDEADRMLDMGFQPQVESIIESLPPKRQTLLFSATLEGRVAKLAHSLAPDAQVVTLDSAPGAGGEIEHVVWSTHGGIKVDTVLEALEMERDLAVVFVRTKRGADGLVERLRAHGVRATGIHGGMTQRERTSEYARFQAGQVDVLVATDVFARGMDLDRITLVINYDLPEDADTYRHRSGRTGRAGRTGTAVTMMTPNQKTSLKRMFRTLDISLKAFDKPRTTKQVKREALPESQHFVPAPTKGGGRGSASPRFGAAAGGGRPERGGKPSGPRPTYGQAKGARGATGGTGAGGGTIANFNETKGFGFITPERGGPDVFFHGKALRDLDPKSLHRGMRVAFRADAHERGLRANEVRPFDPSATEAPRPAAAKPYAAKSAHGSDKPRWNKPKPAGDKPRWEKPRGAGAGAPRPGGKPSGGHGHAGGSSSGKPRFDKPRGAASGGGKGAWSKPGGKPTGKPNAGSPKARAHAGAPKS